MASACADACYKLADLSEAGQQLVASLSLRCLAVLCTCQSNTTGKVRGRQCFDSSILFTRLELMKGWAFSGTDCFCILPLNPAPNPFLFLSQTFSWPLGSISYMRKVLHSILQTVGSLWPLLAVCGLQKSPPTGPISTRPASNQNVESLREP